MYGFKISLWVEAYFILYRLEYIFEHFLCRTKRDIVLQTISSEIFIVITCWDFFAVTV